MTRIEDICCPHCQSKRISFLYCEYRTIIYCQNSQCETWGVIAFMTVHRF
ncbi:MAG: hypothetical protein ACFE9L_18195 [Candidatus Hodarchaeota archaeon]